MTALDAWADWVRQHLDAGRDAFVYFDNDAKVRAPVDAMALIKRLTDSRGQRCRRLLRLGERLGRRGHDDARRELRRGSTSPSLTGTTAD